MVADFPNRTLTCHQAKKWVEDDMAHELTVICKARKLLSSRKKIAIQRPWKQDEKTVTIIDGENLRGGLGGGFSEVSGLTFTNCLSDGYLTSEPAALSVVGNATIRNCRFLDNRSSREGVGALELDGSGSTATVEDCTFERNQTTGFGAGAIYIAGSSVGQLNLRRVNFLHNRSDYEGGAVWVDDPGLLIEDCTFTGNVTGEYGGAVYATEMEGDIIVRDSLFMGNRAYAGGAMLLDNALFNVDARITNCSFIGNDADYGAGALALAKTTCRIESCWFEGNRAEAKGGAIGAINVYGATATFEVVRTVFSGNSAWGLLGAGGDVTTDSPSILIDCHFDNSKGRFAASLDYEAGTHLVERCSFTSGPDSTYPLIRNYPGYLVLDSTFCAITRPQTGLTDPADGGNNRFDADCPDCDGDGIPDEAAIRLRLASDADGDGVPDDCASPCYDIDGDDIVDGADLNILLGQWSETGDNPADLNDDGLVDGADLNLLLGAWGLCL